MLYFILWDTAGDIISYLKSRAVGIGYYDYSPFIGKPSNKIKSFLILIYMKAVCFDNKQGYGVGHKETL